MEVYNEGHRQYFSTPAWQCAEFRRKANIFFRNAGWIPPSRRPGFDFAHFYGEGRPGKKMKKR